MNLEELEHYIKYFNNQKGSPYPCSNQIVICAIITKDMNKALSIMDEKGAVIKRQSINHIEWDFNNERWIWKNWNMNYRGYRFYKIIIDNDIDERLLHWAIAHAGSYCCSMEII